RAVRLEEQSRYGLMSRRTRWVGVPSAARSGGGPPPQTVAGSATRLARPGAAFGVERDHQAEVSGHADDLPGGPAGMPSGVASDQASAVAGQVVVAEGRRPGEGDGATGESDVVGLAEAVTQGEAF